MEINIRPVQTKTELRKFVKCQKLFYKDDPNFVHPLIFERMGLFNEKKNPFFQHSQIKHFVAESNSDIVGRISAIVNGNHNKTHNDKVGFFGFFECIDDQDVANALFRAATEWLEEKGMDTVRGPLNPSQNDEAGLLVEGFDYPPVILMTYNPEYYITLIENAGFSKAKDLYAYHITYGKYKTPKLDRLQKIVRERYNITIREVDFKNKVQFDKDVKTLKEIYNIAWEPNWGFVKMTDAEFDYLAKSLKAVAEPSLSFFIESEGEPAGFAIALPDINKCLIHNKNGGLAGGIWHLLTKKKNIDFLRIIVLGVTPKFHKTGIDSILYYEFGERGPKLNIYNGEASWILEDNVMMNRGLTTTMNGDLYKKYRIYEKPIN